MRADSALSHLHDDELCIAMLHDGSQRRVRWNKQQWRFYFTDTDAPAVCPHEDIKEWRPASIRF